MAKALKKPAGTLPVDPADPQRALREMIAHNKAIEYGSLYFKHPHGLLIFRSYLAYRILKVPVPEDLLEHLDAYAAALDLSDRKEDVLNAIEWTMSRKQLQQLERRRGIVSLVVLLMQEAIASGAELSRPLMKEIAEHVAMKFQTSLGNVRKIVSDWKNDGGNEQTSEGAQNLTTFMANAWR